MPLHPTSYTLALTCALTLLAACSSPAAAAPERQPVWVGEQPDLDACGGLGQISGNGPQAVHAGPGNQHAVIARLQPGTPAWLCDSAGDGQWIGIVHADDPDQDCGVSVAVPAHQPYRGPCRSGWVRATAVQLLAG